MHVIEDATANRVWIRYAQLFEGNAPVATDSRAGPTRELLRASSLIRNPRQRWVYGRVPALNPAFALAETIWILRGRRDLPFLQFWNNALPQFVGGGPTLHGAYGYRLRSGLRGIDQLKLAYDALRSNAASRQVVLQVWDGRIDLPYSDGKPRNADIPCNVIAMLKVRGNRLEWTQVMRSNDLQLGTPHNFVQWTMLQEVMAGWLGLDCGAHALIADSLHVYERDLTNVKIAAIQAEKQPMLVQMEPLNTDDLRLPYEESEYQWRGLEQVVDILRNPRTTQMRMRHLLSSDDAPEAYLNIRRVLVAEAARRHGYMPAMAEAVDAQTNPAYRALWERWARRIQRSGPNE